MPTLLNPLGQRVYLLVTDLRSAWKLKIIVYIFQLVFQPSQLKLQGLSWSLDLNQPLFKFHTVPFLSSNFHVNVTRGRQCKLKLHLINFSKQINVMISREQCIYHSS